MSWKSVLFSVHGRISRTAYWQGGLMVLAYLLLLGIVLVGLLSGGDMPIPERILAVALPLGVLALPALYVTLAIGIKRLHDRDKSGWWALLFYGLPGVLDQIARTLDDDGGLGLAFSLASMAVSTWAMVELGLLRGTPGPNRFGADPMDKGVRVPGGGENIPA